MVEELEANPFTFQGTPLPFGLSYGLAAADPDALPEPDELIQSADTKLYAMKKPGTR